MIPVKEVMTRNVITFREDTPIDEVATTLASKHITGAPVIGSDGHVSGIVSEVDVFSKKGKVARDIMSSHVITVSEDTGIDEAARLLIERKVSGLGCDTMSVEFGASGDFAVHHLTLGAGLYHLENLTNLGGVPETGAYLVVAPIKLQGGSGGAVRVFALVG